MRTADIDADFREFDSANPEVFKLFVRFALFELRALREERRTVDHRKAAGTLEFSANGPAKHAESSTQVAA